MFLKRWIVLILNVDVQDADDDVGGGGEGLGELGAELGADLGDGHHVGPVHDLLLRQGLHLGKQCNPPHCTVLELHVHCTVLELHVQVDL